MRRVMFLWFASTIAAVGFFSAQVSAKELPTSPLSKLKTSELIDRLGNGSFAVRDSATNELLRRGDAVRPDLKAVTNHLDLEVRLRAAEILQRISLLNFETKLTALLTDDKGTKKHDLPCWARYKKIFGNGRPERAFFAEMLRQEYDLLELLDLRPKQAIGLYAVRLEIMYRGNSQTGRPSDVSAPTLAAFLLVSLQPEIYSGSSADMKMYNYLQHRSEPYEAITVGPHRRILKKLLTQMVIHGAEGSRSYYHFQLMMRYDLKEPALNTSRKLVQKHGKSSGSTLQHALMVLGKYGEDEDIALLEPLLENKTVCHSWTRGGNNKILRTQVRDVALAALVQVAEQNHKEYGYKYLMKSPTTMFQLYSMGFDDDQQREVAIAKWRAWSAKREK